MYCEGYCPIIRLKRKLSRQDRTKIASDTTHNMRATRKRNQSNTNEKLGIRAEQQSTLTALHVWVTPIISGWIQAEMLSKFQAFLPPFRLLWRAFSRVHVCPCERDSSISHECGLQNYLCPAALVGLYFSKTRAVITTQQERHGKYTQNNKKRQFCTTSSKFVVYKKKKKKKFSAQPTQRNVVPASKICEVKAGRGIMLVFYRLLTHSHTVMHTVSQSGASQAHIYNTHFTQLPATLETPHVF